MAGHSFGAGIAARAAATDLTTFASLLLICPVGGAGSSVWSWMALARGMVMEFNQELAIKASDSVTAVLRNPLPLTLSAYAAKTADLTGELTTLHRRAVPPTLSWQTMTRSFPPVDCAPRRLRPPVSSQATTDGCCATQRSSRPQRTACSSRPDRIPPITGRRGGPRAIRFHTTLHNVHYRSSIGTSLI